MTLQWFAVQTNPQCENRAASCLREQGFTVYLPEETRWKRGKNLKRERVNRPLFVGYLFVGLGPDTPGGLYEVRLTDGVRGFVLGMDGTPAPAEPRAIYDLQARQAAGEFDHTPARRSPFRKGGHAKILAGPFKGHVGEMLEVDDEGRVRLMLKGIFKGGIVVDDDHLEPVKAAA